MARARLDGIVVSLRAHGEHGAIVRMMTAEQGLVAAYVRGARGRRLSPVLIPGNRVRADLALRSEGQLAQATIELGHSLAPLLGEPLPAAGIAWASALVAAALPEGQPYPRLFAALDGLLAAIEAAPSAAGWAASLVRFELLLLAELGFGLDLSACALTGAQGDLVAVSPRSGRAVSRAAAAPYEGRLLALPRFLLEGGAARWDEVLDGAALTGHFLMRDLLTDRLAPVAEARARLVERLERAAGLA